MRWGCITINEQFYDVDYWIPALARGAKSRLLGRNDGHGCLALGIDSAPLRAPSASALLKDEVD